MQYLVIKSIKPFEIMISYKYCHLNFLSILKACRQKTHNICYYRYKLSNVCWERIELLSLKLLLCCFVIVERCCDKTLNSLKSEL